MPNNLVPKMYLARRSSILAALILFTYGCASFPTKDVPCSANCSDASISSAVRSRLFKEPSLPSAYISVSTINGVVYLHGAVVTSVERDTAVAAARRVDGVVRVVDSIEIGGDE